MSPTVVEDVEILLGRVLTSAEVARAERLAEMAVGLVESALPGFTVTAGTETASIVWNDPAVVWTPKYPVRAVAAVTVDGSAQPAASWRFDERGRIELSVGGSTPTANGPSSAAFSTVDVSYDFGFEVVPGDVAAALATPIANVLRSHSANPDGVQSEQLGPYQVSHGDWAVRQAAAGVVVPMIAKRWNRTRQVSVPLVRFR